MALPVEARLYKGNEFSSAAEDLKGFEYLQSHGTHALGITTALSHYNFFRCRAYSWYFRQG